MIKCLLANNDTVEDKFLSESVLELEYLEKKVLTETDNKLEAQFLWELKLWHVAILSTGLGFALISAICCLVKIRIPRTKTEIEANHKRKALLKQFNGKMKQLNTKDLDEMTYKRALERLRDEYKADSESLAHSEAISIMSLDDNPALLTKNGLDKYTFDPQPLNV